MTARASPASYRFGGFELQPDERRLLAAGAPVAIAPRALDLLVVLVERAGHLVTKDELFDLVWPRVIVEEAALQVQVSALRKILGPDAIATISGRGYRFAPEVSYIATTPTTSAVKHNLPHQLTSFRPRIPRHFAAQDGAAIRRSWGCSREAEDRRAAGRWLVCVRGA